MPSRAISQKISDLASAMLPTPVKAFARQFTETQDPLTETFFKPQEITALADLIAQSEKWAGAKFGPRSSEGEGMRFDVTVPTGKYTDLASLMAMSGQTSGRLPNLTAGLKDDELLRHHYKNIAEGKTKEHDDGRLSTVYSRTVNHPDLNDGKPTLIPSVWDGKILNEDAAVKKAIDSKRKWTTRDTHEELRALDIMLHQDMRPDTTKEEAKRRISEWNQ